MGLLSDLRHAFRNLSVSRGFALTAVLTLALGLAAVSTIFAVVETVLLRPLDFPQSDRIFAISQNLPVLGAGPSVVNLGEFQRWEKSGLFEHAAALETTEYTLVGQGRAERIYGVNVTIGFLSCLPGPAVPRPGISG